MLFRKKIERSCQYCIHCASLDENTVLCTKRGIRHVDQSCGRFKYDPFKRVPKKAKPIDFSRYDEDDFSL